MLTEEAEDSQYTQHATPLYKVLASSSDLPMICVMLTCATRNIRFHLELPRCTMFILSSICN